MTTMGPQPAGPADLDTMPTGTRFEIALLLTETATNEVTGTVLQRDDDGVYHSTERVVTVRWEPGTPLYMGQPSDIRTGGAFQARGVLSSANTVTADRLAILTGYVEVR
ncbi:MAG TPA: hypothetical protein VJ914_28755 [Pseudonocardiaceae bacterium]|nr:hypothetical protein [Pseudonocardiaceae bacterium]